MVFNSLIPLPYYTPVFYNTVLFLLLFAFLKLQTKGYIINTPFKKEYQSLTLMLLLTLYLGLRPISGMYFGDMGVYNLRFEQYANGAEIMITKDVFWHVFMKFCSTIMSAKIFFLLCAVLYITPLYLACKKWFANSMYIPFLMLVASFSFWAYGTNGIRNGIATSFIILALSYDNRSKWKYILFFLALSAHQSVMIPVAAFVLTLFNNNPKYYLWGWLAAIPLSLVLGNFWGNFFASLGFQDQRISYLIEGNLYDDNFAYTGFRWDFVIYSATAVFIGYYIIFKKKFKDKLYHQLFNIYVTANAFWILVIRANFSNRFAYLSWFLMAIIVFYPFFKEQFFKTQQKILAYLLLLYFGFTYVMTL